MTRAGLLRLSILLIAIVALCLSSSGCGGSKATSARTKSVATKHVTEEPKLDADKDTDGETPDEDDGKPAPPTDRDGDTDGEGHHGRYDSDDQRVDEFGHRMSGPEETTIARLVRRYFAVVHSGNGAKACTMLYTVLAEAVPEDYGTSPPGPSYARGTTCAQVLTKVFAHFRERTNAEYPKLDVAEVRRNGREAIALLTFGRLPERTIHLMREGHRWRIQAMLDEEME